MPYLRVQFRYSVFYDGRFRIKHFRHIIIEGLDEIFPEMHVVTKMADFASTNLTKPHQNP